MLSYQLLVVVQVLSQSFINSGLNEGDDKPSDIRGPDMISFKGAHYPKSVVLYALFFYVRYGVSYRDLEEIMAERGVDFDHATLNRWVVKYAPQITANTQARKKPTA